MHKKTLSERTDYNQNRQLIGTVSDLRSLRNKLSEQKIILGTGCFDLLHVGHLYFLKEARKQGDVLVVGINSDRSVSAIKGPDRPIIKQDQRAEILAAFRYVDYVFIYDSVVADDCILTLKPDVYAIGEESVNGYPSELAAANSVKARVHVIKRIPSLSTTSVVSNILKTNLNKD